jgi:hypothetical protein
MEEALEYGCEKTKTNSNLERIAHLKEEHLTPNEAELNWNEFYGIAKGLRRTLTKSQCRLPALTFC